MHDDTASHTFVRALSDVNESQKKRGTIVWQFIFLSNRIIIHRTRIEEDELQKKKEKKRKKNASSVCIIINLL